MKNLIQFFIRFHFLILFIIIESGSLTIAFQYNYYQKAGVVTMFQNISGFYHSKVFSIKEYLNLRETNQQLAYENVRINNILQQAYRSDDIFFYKQEDTINRQRFYLTSAKIINNSVNKKHNFLTLNKGSEQGLKPDMAVISTNGVVGVIYDVSRFYSTVISLLNTNMKVSSKLLKNDYFGSLEWDGKDYRHAILNEIPYHVNVERGDTIVTSGYSAIFPEGVMIGTIEDFKIKGGNFYEINIALSTDFKHLTFVSVVSNLKKEGQKNLENTFPND